MFQNPIAYTTHQFFKPVLLGLIAVTVCLLWQPGESQAQLTSEHRRELTKLRREITKVSTLARRDQIEEAQQLLDDAEQTLEKIMSESGLPETDRAISGAKRAIDLQKQNLAKAQGKGGSKKGGVSFAKDVAPILVDNCLGCHDDSASGNLRLDTFAAMRRGGRSGPQALVVPGAPQRSLLAMKLIANPPQRMPRNRPALESAEIKTIADWITQGAKYDAQDQTMQLADLANLAEKGMTEIPKIEVARPDGTETVSFTKDVAPMLVTFCHGCHSGNNPRSGFSVETFEKILIGGDSGEVLIAGKLEDSRLFRLTGGLENPRMPQGQARITRKNYNDLRTWILEGIKYDSPNPKTPLLDLVPSDAEVRAMELEKMTDADFRKLREERAASHWKRTLSSAELVNAENNEFYVVGNVTQPRVQQVLDWAAQLHGQLTGQLKINQAPSWKGRLAIYVFKDRYDYDEFNRSVVNRNPEKGLFGHARVSATQEEAYIAVLDTSDTPQSNQPHLKYTLAKTLISAALQADATARVDWLHSGAGWALVDAEIRNQDYERYMTNSAAAALRSLDRPEYLFRAGTFPPDLTEHVGFLTVRFLISSGSLDQFQRFSDALEKGQTIEQACRSIYRRSPEELAQALIAKLR